MCEGESDGGRMRGILSGRRVGLWLALGMVAMAAARSQAGTPLQASCAKALLTGEVNAGQEWRAAFGEGWVFRVLPIQTGKGGVREGVYSGWDLAVDREQPAGFPDALLVATPRYNSINEREVGTTFGLRARDAIGWNPHSFRFLTSSSPFPESQKLYQPLGRDGQLSLASPESAGQNTPEAGSIRRLLELAGQSSAGMFRIVDARLTAGVADAAPYAENWALQSRRRRIRTSLRPRGKSTPKGKLDWMRFSVTLWLPGAWKAPAELHAAPGACLE